MDKIHIRDLAVECIIGTEPHERVRKQPVLINLELACDLSRAGCTDRIDDTVNYKVIRDKVVRIVERSAYELIEALAAKIADVCLENPQVLSVNVVVDKPGALTMSRSVAVELRRARQGPA
jgi:FolB domain-containing protein